MTATTIETVEARAGDAAPAAEVAGGPRWLRRLGVAGLAWLAVPIVAAGVVALTRTWLPPSDHGLIQLRVADVGGPMTPLLGAYSRLGWNHPGPLAFWILAVPYRLLGSTTKGLLVGILLLNTAALAGCLGLARRRGGLALTVVVGCALAALIRGYGAAFLFYTWNPDLPVLPTAFLVMAVWSVVEGDVRLLPAVVAVSCYAWQSHLGYLPVTGGLAALALGAAALRALAVRRLPPGERRVREAADRPGLVAAATAVTAAVCLAPLVVEQATNQPGNLRLIAGSFLHPTEEAAGLGFAARVVGRVLAPAGTWISGWEPANAFTGAALGGHLARLALPVAAIGLAAVVAWRARAAAALRFLAVTSAAAVLAFVAVWRTTGLPYNYLFNWLRPVAALLWASVAWSLWCGLRSSAWFAGRERLVRGTAWGTVALATAVLSVWSLRNGVGLEFQEDTPAQELQHLVPATLDAVAGYDHVYLRTVGGWCAGELGNGLAAQLTAHGTEVAVPPNLGTAYGPDRVRRDIVPTVEMFCGPVAKDTIANLPIRPIVTYSILTGAEERELRALQEGFRRQLRAAGREDLVPAVDSHLMTEVDRMHVRGTDFDPADIARFTVLMQRSQQSVAIYFRPFGPNNPP